MGIAQSIQVQGNKKKQCADKEAETYIQVQMRWRKANNRECIFTNQGEKATVEKGGWRRERDEMRAQSRGNDTVISYARVMARDTGY